MSARCDFGAHSRAVWHIMVLRVSLGVRPQSDFSAADMQEYWEMSSSLVTGDGVDEKRGKPFLRTYRAVSNAQIQIYESCATGSVFV